MKNSKSSILLYILFVMFVSSCKFYKQDVMFKTENSVNEVEFRAAVLRAESGYRLRKGDLLSFKLFTNKGEVMIDPNYDLAKQLGAGKNNASFTTQGGSVAQMSYLIHDEGSVLLPMIGKLKVDSLTQNQFDSLLAVKYSAYYQDPFIVSQTNSKRVVIINGKKSKVLMLDNQKMNLIEALAATEGIEEYSVVKNIRIIRGDLKNPSVQLVDLSTIEGLKKADLTLLPDDIVYIEPGRSKGREMIKDFQPFFMIVYSTLTLMLILSSRL